jgi:hypothetical protein
LLWMHINSADQRIQFSFDNRNVTLNFKKADEK